MEYGESGPADLDARQGVVRVVDDEILVSWHAPTTPPDGRAHGAEGICVTGSGDVIVISRDGRRWELPAGRPDGDETWEQTLRRKVREEACATVVRARLLGFARARELDIARHPSAPILRRALREAGIGDR